MAGFAAWCKDFGVEGFVGEVGWPHDADPRWLDLAKAWYDTAQSGGLRVTAWAAGPWWRDYDLLIYGARSATPSADVVEAASTRGVNMSIGEWGTDNGFSNANPGEYGRTYRYAESGHYRYLARRGIDTVRIPFRWERLQPEIGGSLDPVEMARFTDSVEAARQAGLQVIVDAHNQGAYQTEDGALVLGSEIGAEELVTLWVPLAQAFPGVVLDLMNEPHLVHSSRAWEQVSSEAVRMLRAQGIDNLTTVGGHQYSGVHEWSSLHAEPWIDDGNTWFQGHHYFDGNHSGHYDTSYDAVLAQVAPEEPTAPEPTPTPTALPSPTPEPSPTPSPMPEVVRDVGILTSILTALMSPWGLVAVLVVGLILGALALRLYRDRKDS